MVHASAIIEGLASGPAALPVRGQDGEHRHGMAQRRPDARYAFPQSLPLLAIRLRLWLPSPEINAAAVAQLPGLLTERLAFVSKQTHRMWARPPPEIALKEGKAEGSEGMRG